jgi:hypothetical protein
VLGVAVIALIAVSVLTRPWQSDQDRLRARPEASLVYPGSTVLREGGYDATTEAVAGIWRQLATTASMDEILAFYRAELAAAGWETGGGCCVFSALHERQTCAWHRSDVVLRLSFWNMEQFAERYPDDAANATVYEVRLMDHGSTSNATACSLGILEYAPSLQAPSRDVPG